MASGDDKNKLKGVQQPKGELSSQDSSKCELTLCCWNVYGKAKAEVRQETLTKFFSDKEYDIICLQEVPVDPDRKTFEKYFPFPNSEYWKEHNKEESSSKFSAVVCCKDKVGKTATFDEKKLEKAYRLMETKANVYKKIVEKKLSKEAVITKLTSKDLDDEERSILEEVRAELDVCNLEKIKLRYRYKQDGENEIRSPKQLLHPRMVAAFLQTKNNKELVVFSVHFPYTKMSAEGFAYLFFDFLAKVDIDCPIVIAGDFNRNITEVKVIERFLEEFSVPTYNLPKSRPQRIDFILTKNPSWHSRSVVTLGEVLAQDFEVPPGVDKISVTNHSPLTTTLTIEKRVNGTSSVNEKSLEKASPSVKDESFSTPSDKDLNNASIKVKEESSDK